MTINRIHRKRNNFSTISNEGAHDQNLSWQAKGLLWYLCTKPDGWEVMEGDLARQTEAGIKAVRSIIKQLEQAGYLVRWCERGDRGLLRWRSEIFESKADTQAWIVENVDLLKSAVRLTPGTIESASSIYPFGVHGEGSSIYPLSIDGQTMHGDTIDGATMHGQQAHLINTKEINYGIDQKLNEASTHSNNGTGPKTEESEGTAAPEKPIEPEQPKQPTSETPPTPLPVNQEALASQAVIREDQSSAAPPAENWRESESFKREKRPPWRNSDGSFHPAIVRGLHSSGGNPSGSNIYNLPNGNINTPKINKVLRRLDTAAMYASYKPQCPSTCELQDYWQLGLDLDRSPQTKPSNVVPLDFRAQAWQSEMDKALALIAAGGF